MQKRIVAIVGPTASGKTALSIEIAKNYNGEVVSCDSMQIYKYMDIGTAKPTKDEMRGIPHHMIDIINPDVSYNVVNFANDAKKYIDDILGRGKLPVLVGGTGLYIDSVLNNIKFSESDKDENYRNSLESLAGQKGNEYVHSMLKPIDPVSYEKIHPNNLRRTIRALEVYKTTGKTITQANIESIRESEYDAVILGLNMDRNMLYDRINKRVDLMFKNDLLGEVQGLVNRGIGRGTTAMQAIGYKEVLDYLDNKASFDETVEKIKLESRRYAKRQLTWFKRNSKINWLILQEDYNFNTIYKQASLLLKSLL